jgi:hypothetical protein
MTSNPQLHPHQNTYHTHVDRMKTSADNEAHVVDVTNLHGYDDTQMVVNNFTSGQQVDIDFTRKETTNYFLQMHMPISGLSFLATGSAFKNDLVAPDLDDIDSQLSYQLAKLYFSITRLQRDNLAEVLELICIKNEPIKSIDSIIPEPTYKWSIELPQTSSLLRNRSITGRTSYVVIFCTRQSR